MARLMRPPARVGISLKPSHLQRYRDIARLFFKHGRGDLLRGSGLDEATLRANGGAGPQLPARQAPAAGESSRSDDRVHTAAEELAKDLESLGPTFIKVGQFLSTRPDLLPLPYLDALSRLQDRVEPFAWADVERIVSEDLGVRIQKAFESFDPEPIAAASLGQVHRARLHSGRDVAVKVQRPDIRQVVRDDLEALEEIAEILDRHTDLGRRNDFGSMLEEFRATLMREMDYRREARNLTVVGENLAEFDRIMVPSPVEDYVSARVLTMEFVRGRKVTALGPLARMELEGAPLAEDLCRAYLKQILVDGFFHADPHPGNVFVTDDGRIALLDLGMVAHLAPEMQESLLKLVLAVSEGHGDDAGQRVVALGRPIGEADTVEVRRRIAELVVEHQGLRIKDIALGRVVLEAASIATDHNLRLPREMTLLAKTLLNVDEVTRRLDPEFDPNAAIRRNASAIMTQRMLKSFSPGKLFGGLLEMKQVVEKLPARVNQLLEAVAENRFRIKIEAIDEVLLMEGLQKIANRITLGLVVSALVVGAALLMRVPSTFRILGYPGLPMLFFLGAAVGGVMLVTNILLHDLRTRKDRLRSLERHLMPDAHNHRR